MIDGRARLLGGNPLPIGWPEIAPLKSAGTCRLRIRAWLARPPLWCTLSLCAVVLIARRPDVVQNPQLWAEDGPVFFAQSRTMGAEALLHPSAGYLHTVLRLIAWLAAWLDPVLTPAMYALAAALLTLYVAALTQSPRFPLPPSVGYALAVVSVPDAFEVLLTLTNLQWVLAGGLLLLLLSREPKTVAQRSHDLVAAVLLALTGPFVVVLAPLFAWRALSRRTRFSAMLGLVVLACAALQGWMILRDLRAANSEPIALELLLAVPGVRIGGSLLSGGEWNAGVGVLAATALGVVTIGGVVVLATRRGAARAERIWLAVGFVGLLGVSLYRCRDVLPALLHGAGARYFFPLQLIALWLLIAAMGAAAPWVARVAAGLLVLIAAVNVARLREPPLRDLHWVEYVAQIRKGEYTTVQINPDWEFAMPARQPRETPAPPLAWGSGSATRTALVNGSTRCLVTPERPAIVGFVLHPGGPRTILIRAIGPSLTTFGIEAPLPCPRLTLRRDGVYAAVFGPATHAAQDDAVARAAQRCGAFPLAPGAGDVVSLIVLPPGSYTVTVASDGVDTGEVLLEIYDVPDEPALR